MSCEDASIRLDDYLDGALPLAEAVALHRHLDTCASCRDEEQALRAILAAAGSLPTERTPARDLWPEVAARLRPARPRLRVSWPAGLAAAAALAAVSSALTAVALRGRVETPPAGVSGERPPGLARRAALVGTVDAAEAEYVQATSALLQALEARRAELPPETVAMVEENLRTIDTALGEIRGALARDPGNPGLVHMLVATHGKKVDTLERVLKLSTRT